MCQGTEEEFVGIAQWYSPHIIRSTKGPIIVVEIVTTKSLKSKVIQKEGKIFNKFLYM